LKESSTGTSPGLPATTVPSSERPVRPGIIQTVSNERTTITLTIHSMHNAMHQSHSYQTLHCLGFIPMHSPRYTRDPLPIFGLPSVAATTFQQLETCSPVVQFSVASGARRYGGASIPQSVTFGQDKSNQVQASGRWQGVTLSRFQVPLREQARTKCR
jgi:hypothetical protein